MAKDPYTVLGVAKDAKDADIQKAFRRQAKKYHPDLNPGDKKAEDRFKELNAAYDIVGDAAKRARYDRGEIDANGTEIRPNPFARGGPGAGGFRGGFQGGFQGGGFNPGGGGGAGGGAQGFAFEDLGDLFGGIFGGGRAGASARGPAFQGDDARYNLEVDFLDAARGGKKRLTLPSGKALDVNIPAGIADGQTIRLKGQGEPGAGKAGDALIEVKVREHPLFKRDGNNIRIELPITLQEAVLGGKVEVPTIHGTVSMTVPKGTNTGRTMRLKGQGIAAGKNAPAGDQYIKLLVVLPPGGNAELEKFVAEWGPKVPYDPRADLEKG
jgi:DnaJ-class molecular chaperone